MSINEIESKVKELRQLQALIEEATAEAETIKDAITSAGKDRKAKGGGRNWKQQRDDAVICA